jgi:NAD(P)-dependent dehydrogenase (short-subunit alcohol dehydrogenase family)
MAGQWTVQQIPSQLGKRAIVTGANIGLGFQTARELARAGAQVVMACRSLERGNAAAEKIKAEQPSAQISVALLDLSSLASVRSFAQSAIAAGEPVDLLINNAGMMALPKREVSVDGFEMQLATNYLGHFALTGLLLPVLLRAGAPRVVSVSSNAHKRGQLHLDDFQQERGYSPFKSYGQTKLAMLVFARELQKQSEAHGSKLVSVAAHPGLSSTAIVRKLEGPPKFIIPLVVGVLGQSDAQGALPQLYAATSAQAQAGGYYGPHGFSEFKGYPVPAKVASQAADPAAGPRLWTASEQATGVTYDWAAKA